MLSDISILRIFAESADPIITLNPVVGAIVDNKVPFKNIIAFLIFDLIKVCINTGFR